MIAKRITILLCALALPTLSACGLLPTSTQDKLATSPIVVSAQAAVVKAEQSATGTTRLGTATDQHEAEIVNLASFAIVDLQSAAADAAANNDPVAGQCWNGLIPVVQTIQSLLAPPAPVTPVTPPASCGDHCVFTKFQQLRDTKTRLDALVQLRNSGQLAKLRQAINLACGALWVDVRAGIADPLGLASGPAGP